MRTKGRDCVIVEREAEWQTSDLSTLFSCRQVYFQPLINIMQKRHTRNNCHLAKASIIPPFARLFIPSIL